VKTPGANRERPSKNWRLGRGFAAHAHVLAVVAPPAPAPQSLRVASGVDVPLSSCSFGDTLFLSQQRFSLPITYHTSKNRAATRRRRAEERARFPVDFAVTTKGPQWQSFFKARAKFGAY